jgi:hypothetical protein
MGTIHPRGESEMANKKDLKSDSFPAKIAPEKGDNFSKLQRLISKKTKAKDAVNKARKETKEKTAALKQHEKKAFMEGFVSYCASNGLSEKEITNLLIG